MNNESDFNIDFIKYEWKGELGMAMAPGKNYNWTNQKRNLEKDLGKIKNTYKVDLIVCLLEPEEMGWLGIPNELEVCEKMQIPTEHYPIEDMDAPGDIERFKKLVKKIVDEYLKEGKRVMVHCQGGNGRTGTFVAACYIYMGYKADKAIEKTREIRRYAIESRYQERFLRDLEF